MQEEPSSSEKTSKNTPEAADPPKAGAQALCALECSLNDAEVLTNYAVRNNITGLENDILGIAKAREQFTAGNLKGDAQRDFYAYYSALASAVAPVTVASLKASLDEYGVEVRNWFGLGKKRLLSRAGIAARAQSILATLVLFALVIVQSYWLIGNTFLLAAPSRTAQEIQALRQAEADDAAYVSAQNQNQAQAQPVSGEELKTLREKAKAAAQVLEQSHSQDLHREEIARMLATWAGYFPFNLTILDQSSKKIEREIVIDRVFTICGRILDVIQQYILPLLYGLLGAMAYVIRTISKQARDREYRVEDETGYYLRIWLGILGGLAIGWFFKPSGEGVGALSPLALAFVAGYSVDLLFTAMDRVVSAFSGLEKSSDKQEQAAQPAVAKA